MQTGQRFCPISTKFRASRRIGIEVTTKFHGNPFNGIRAATWGQADV